MIIIKNPEESLKSSNLLIQEGRILAFKPLDQKDQAKRKEKNLKIIAPGFINTHCHLAYTNLQIPSQNLFKWIMALMQKTFANENFDAGKNSLDGAMEALSFGTTFLVDNSNHCQASIEAFKKSRIKGLIGLEVFGSNPEDAKEIFDTKIKELESYKESIEAKKLDLDIVLSPHASYDVSKELWELCLEWSQSKNKKLLSHLAESQEEETWFQKQEATNAREFWQSIGTLEIKEKNWQAYKSSVDFMKSNKLLHKNLLATHLCQAEQEDLVSLKEAQVGLVTCPRSNQYLGNKLADISLWEELGLSYALGTDSKASNTDLDLRKEVNSLSEIYPLSPKRKLELLTSSPAKILGRDDLASLDIGKSADYTVFEIKAKDLEKIDIEAIDPLELLFRTDICKAKEVYIDGINVYRAPLS